MFKHKTKQCLYARDLLIRSDLKCWAEPHQAIVADQSDALLITDKSNSSGKRTCALVGVSGY